jgi:hypothetical protein
LNVLILLALLLSGCATYQQHVEGARHDLESQQFEAAIERLRPLAKKPSDDQLIYLFDYATALQVAGRYQESNKVLQEADKLSDEKDYLSLSRLGGSLLLNEEMMQYRGEDYEKLLINVMGAINYTMLKDRESALVEVRRLNDKMESFRQARNLQFEQNTLVMYLSALLWESDKNWDSAYIDFERAYKRDSSIPYLQEDLLRAALRAGREEEAKKWQKKFGLKSKPEWRDKNLGELVLIYQQGWGPRKAERPRVAVGVGTGFVSPGFPELRSVPTQTQKARLEVFPAESPASSPIRLEESQLVYNLESVAIKTLEESYAPLIAKRVAAYVARAQIAQQMNKKNEGLGSLLNLVAQIADRADLRQWSTLPATYNVAKVTLPSGRYRVRVSGLTASSGDSGESSPEQEVEIKPGQKTFIGWRSFR